MEIVRHCSERLSGGARLWQRVAKEAGFSGILRVSGNPLEVDSEQAVIGKMEYPTIRVVVPHSACSVQRKWETVGAKYNPLLVFGHELYHWRRAERGYFHASKGSFSSYRKDTEERNADAYARRLLKRVASG